MGPTSHVALLRRFSAMLLASTASRALVSLQRKPQRTAWQFWRASEENFEYPLLFRVGIDFHTVLIYCRLLCMLFDWDGELASCWQHCAPLHLLFIDLRSQMV